MMLPWTRVVIVLTNKGKFCKIAKCVNEDKRKYTHLQGRFKKRTPDFVQVVKMIVKRTQQNKSYMFCCVLKVRNSDTLVI